VGGLGDEDLDFDRSLDEMLPKMFLVGDVGDGAGVSLEDVVLSDTRSKFVSFLYEVVI